LSPASSYFSFNFFFCWLGQLLFPLGSSLISSYYFFFQKKKEEMKKEEPEEKFSFLMIRIEPDNLFFYNLWLDLNESLSELLVLSLKYQFIFLMAQPIIMPLFLLGHRN